MTVSDQELYAWLDGELPPARAGDTERAVAADPALATRAEQARRARSLLAEGFPVVADPRDQALARLILDGPARRPMFSLPEGLRWPQLALAGAAAAACFGVGLSIGLLKPETPPLIGQGGALADAALVRVLDSRRAVDGADARGRAVGLTFQDAEGRWCRTFAAGEAGLAGLACREGEGWKAEVVAPFETAGTELRTASADIPAAVLAAVDASAASDPLDAQAEAELLARWKGE